jgi:hypothetical protein
MSVLIGYYNNVVEGDASRIDWTNPSYAGDSTAETYAEVTIPTTTTTSKYSEDLQSDTHSIDTTAQTEYILKVEVGVTAYSTLGDDGGEYRESVLGGYDPTSGSAGSYQYITTTPATYWLDVTSDYDMPGYGFWTWEKVKNLLVYFRSHRYDGETNSSDNIVYVDQLLIRVTTQATPIKFYGLRCYDSSANITLDVTDRITRVLFKKEVASLEDSYENFPLPPGGLNRVFGFSYALDGTSGGLSHGVSVSQVSATELRCTWTSKSSYISGEGVYAIPSAPSLVIVVGW